MIEAASKIGAEWKSLPEQQKQKYIDQAKKLSEKHDSEIAEYEKKYVDPFKTKTYAALVLKDLYSNSTVKANNIKEGASIVK